MAMGYADVLRLYVSLAFITGTVKNHLEHTKYQSTSHLHKYIPFQKIQAHYNPNTAIFYHIPISIIHSLTFVDWDRHDITIHPTTFTLAFIYEKFVAIGVSSLKYIWAVRFFRCIHIYFGMSH